MKKLMILFLALAMLLSLCACGGGSDAPKTDDSTPAAAEPQTEEPAEVPEEAPEPEVQTLALGETVSTDLVEFVLEDCVLTFYVSNSASTLFEPTEEPNDTFVASMGQCLVASTYTIKNKDRADLDYRGASMHVLYQGETYPVSGYTGDSTSRRGYNLQNSVFVYSDGSCSKWNTSDNHYIGAGESLTVRSLGVVYFEPSALTDGFDVEIGIPNSQGEYEYFTYTIPEQK